MRKLIVLSWLLLLLAGVSYMFWKQEVKYLLPTPVPKSYVAVNTGEHINLGGRIQAGAKPVFIHFFNPDCPCSRFNMPHFQSLVKKYGSDIDFSVVVINKNKQYSAEEIKSKYDLDIPVSFDTTIAASCGVYSTPQAVLLTAQHNLYYRGNYNKSRYCTDAQSNFAQMAIDSFLNSHATPAFGSLAFKAYGCELPYCTK